MESGLVQWWLLTHIGNTAASQRIKALTVKQRAERLGSAGIYRRHNFKLAEADMLSIGPPPRSPMTLKNISYLQLRFGQLAGIYPSRCRRPLMFNALRDSNGLACHRWFWWRRVCSARSCSAWHGQATPGSKARDCHGENRVSRQNELEELQAKAREFRRMASPQRSN